MRAAILFAAFLTLMATGANSRAEPASRFDFKSGPVEVYLSRRPLVVSKIGLTKDRQHSTIDGVPVLGAFGGLDQRALGPHGRRLYEELLVEIVWKDQKRRLRVPTRVVHAALHKGDDDSPLVRVSKDDDSVLVIVWCGDAVLELVAMQIDAKGKLTRYVIDGRS